MWTNLAARTVTTCECRASDTLTVEAGGCYCEVEMRNDHRAYYPGYYRPLSSWRGESEPGCRGVMDT